MSQPSPWNHYMMKLVCDVFGIFDHSSNRWYAYLCNECAAGTDHTLTFFDHFIRMYIDKWVWHLTLCLDNACKNSTLKHGQWSWLRRGGLTQFDLFTVRHTKLGQDIFFSSIAKTYNSDAFCIEVLHHIFQQYAISTVFTSNLYYNVVLGYDYPCNKVVAWM